MPCFDLIWRCEARGDCIQFTHSCEEPSSLDSIRRKVLLNTNHLPRFSMKASEFATVCTTRTPIEADLLISVLRDAGLHPLELGTFGHVFLGGADIDYAVRVPAAELLEAQDLLRQCHGQKD